MDRMPWRTSSVRDCLKWIAISLRYHDFSGEYPILVLKFLAQFMSGAYILEISEGQAYVALPFFLRGVAEDPFLSI